MKLTSPLKRRPASPAGRRMHRKPEKKVNVIELAEKKRHLHLLERLQKGVVPSKADLKELKRFESGEAGAGVVETQHDVAKCFGVSARTVAYWATDGMPVRPDGRFELAEILRWKKEREALRANGNGSLNDDWDEKDKEYKAKQRELEFRKSSGELIEVRDVEKTAFETARKVRDNFLMLPDRLAPILAAETDQIKVKNILSNEIREILKGLA
jgi:phage terminase Nu1 subunit (DNA packaging protein)